jgi:hypothetical protein
MSLYDGPKVTIAANETPQAIGAQGRKSSACWIMITSASANNAAGAFIGGTTTSLANGRGTPIAPGDSLLLPASGDGREAHDLSRTFISATLNDIFYYSYLKS